ncbi:MAG: ribulose-phosphate 3-epimerase [Candidatus Kapabacteria bacterium]|nr:ribulose-phosphate 3-epimerase [Candidatus Kapabacteria bacterium]
MIQIAPSLLAADLLRIGDQVMSCEQAGADILHVDVMDGHFVPPITFGPAFVKGLRAITSMPLDVHLMVTNPDHQVEQFAEAGAHWISVHAEVAPHLHRTLARIKNLGCRAGVVLNPATPLEYAFEAAGDADFILLMSVNPGYGGQSFIPSFLTRCERVRTWLDTNGLSNVQIEVDGGIKIDNARQAVDAGASILVSGSGLFQGDLKANISAMRQVISA